MSENKPYLTPPEAAQKAGVVTQTATRWCRRIPGFATRVAGRWRVNPDALDLVIAGKLGLDGEQK